MHAELDVTGLIVSNCPYLTYDFLSAPKGCLNDGFLDIIFGAASMTRWQMIQMFLQSETGGYVNFPSIHYFKAKEVMITGIPKAGCHSYLGYAAKQGLFDLDGEPFSADLPLHLCIHSERLRVCC
mmetsp:Transcript_7073/g.12630  ORF Transcript_7073/g.12630 Transcript_7073/m.12630 type:complete len:125 (-) Transcript_7073:80-454(-)